MFWLTLFENRNITAGVEDAGPISIPAVTVPCASQITPVVGAKVKFCSDPPAQRQEPDASMLVKTSVSPVLLNTEKWLARTA